MADDEHKRRRVKGEFCANAAKDDCGCDSHNDYRGNCKPAPAWDVSVADYAYAQIGKNKGSKKKFRWKHGYEAHHLLCVGTVTKVLIDGRGISQIIRETRWCVNNPMNMHAMPMWGHTIKYYCDIDTQTVGSGGSQPPPWKNIPQHDWDHNSKKGYRFEVEEQLKAVAKKLRENKKQHKAEAKKLPDTLEKLSDHFFGQLKERGERCEGTDNGWKKGGKRKDWFHPFSMGNDGCVTEKGYPRGDFDQQTAGKLKWLKDQLTGKL
ncbi:MAG TPA: hypothetical protein VKB41_17460 [Steroidobacteraceae bacterium]|jgi:hypothetical protein|nr:hypothetical protein [Steroidobacteraceae bacterium]